MEESLYNWRKRMRICVQCGKEKPFPGYVRCPMCIEKAEEASRKCWQDEGKRIRYNKHGAERHKELRLERKEKGLCPKCGKPIKDGTHITCSQCRTKHNVDRRAKSIRRPGEHFKERIEAGVCMYCGGDLAPGYKLCEKCLEKRRRINKGINPKASEKWRKEITVGWNAKQKSSGNG